MPAKNRFARGMFAVLSAMLLVASLAGWAASERYLSGLSKVKVFEGLSGSAGWNGDPVNILVVGSDDRSGLSKKQKSRHRTGFEDYGRHTDTLMLMHLGADLANVSVVSIPRDSLVQIPAHTDPNGEKVKARRGKINSAFSTGGPATTVKTVQQATGVTIDHYVEVNFKGFLSMVDAVEGVPVCLRKPLKDFNSGLDLPAGKQTIRGKQALAYVRARYIDNDFGRAGRQQKFIAAMAQKVTGSNVLLNPLSLNSFVDAAVSSVTTDERLGRDDIAALAARIADIELSKIEFTTVPISDGSHFHDGESTVLWDGDAADTLFASLRDDQPLPTPPKATPVEVAPGDISITVIAGDTVLLNDAEDDLSAAGFETTTLTGTTPKRTTVRYDPLWQRSLQTVKAAFPTAKFVEAPGSGGFQLQVGKNYEGVHPVRAASTSVVSTVRSAKDDLCSD